MQNRPLRSDSRQRNKKKPKQGETSPVSTSSFANEARMLLPFPHRFLVFHPSFQRLPTPFETKRWTLLVPSPSRETSERRKRKKRKKSGARSARTIELYPFVVGWCLDRFLLSFPSKRNLVSIRDLRLAHLFRRRFHLSIPRRIGSPPSSVYFIIFFVFFFRDPYPPFILVHVNLLLIFFSVFFFFVVVDLVHGIPRLRM